MKTRKSKPKSKPEPKPDEPTGRELLEDWQALEGLKYSAAIEITRVLDDICSESSGAFKQADFDRDVMQLVRDARRSIDTPNRG